MQTEKHVLDASYLFPEEMRGITKPIILKNIDNPSVSPESIFYAYGTHIITEASIGGLIQVTGVYRSSESISKTDFSAAIKFACAYVSAEARTSMTNEQKKILSNTSMLGRSYGGDVAITLGTLSLEDIPNMFKAWGNSIRNKKDQVLAKVYSYTPIWGLAKDEARQKQLREYFIALAQDKYKGLADYFIVKPSRPPVPVVVEARLDRDGLPCAYWGGNRIAPMGLFLPKVNSDTTFIMQYNDDDTVSFFHKEQKRYVTMHYNSNLPGAQGRDASQLWLFNEIVEERQKFNLIPFGDKVKIQSVKNKLFVKGRTVTPNTEPFLLYFADVSEANAELFEIKTLN